MTRTRPLIGLTGRTKRGAEVAGIVSSLDEVEVDVYIRDYARAIHEAGGLPVHLPGFIDPGAYAGRLDGIVLSGGTDIDPRQYGAAAHTEAYEPEPERDRFELGLIDLGVAEEIPILGICRGAQLLNVWAGGTLRQHVPSHARYDTPADAAVDVAVVEPGTTLHGLFGDRVPINSLHHQTIDRLAAGWRVSARSADGEVEALEWPGHDVVAVQWHPELLATRAGDPLFTWVVERARARGTEPGVGAKGSAA
jgi:putative glutamine amidotransferase